MVLRDDALDPELASYLQIEKRELEAGGLNRRCVLTDSI